ncbi:CLUMA_CG001041, isoform A [Clunio marinus]|uniref:CLUMA_CG001041, isoform A n=1 Tax=Clunio marinus TaxID=568069 RepID=A0A1J1HGV3_9DIPT|nr:CLUMA_CG001041, isoform A [Clunio marinus]
MEEDIKPMTIIAKGTVSTATFAAQAVELLNGDFFPCLRIFVVQLFHYENLPVFSSLPYLMILMAIRYKVVK